MLEEGLYAKVELVALDPMLEMVTSVFATMIYLVTLDWQSFIDRNIGMEKPIDW